MTVTDEAIKVAEVAFSLPETFWEVDDDLCDCMYQRIGMWTNPYLAETLEVRMCCIWKQLYELFPTKVRATQAFKDYNAGTWVTEPAEWDAEFDMPKAIWYRQLARKTGKSVAEVREEYRDRDDERPRGVPRPPAPEDTMPDPVEVLWSAMQDLAETVMSLKEQVEGLCARPLSS